MCGVCICVFCLFIGTFVNEMHLKTCMLCSEERKISNKAWANPKVCIYIYDIIRYLYGHHDVSTTICHLFVCMDISIYISI